jgi:hypothetical protein
VADVLLYSTPDSDFADSAVEALRRHKIACYRTGTVTSGVRGAVGEQYSIFIHTAADYGRANTVLVKLGAVTDEPVRSLPRWAIWAAIALVIAVIALTAVYGKQY